jgi:hypothetical protein
MYSRIMALKYQLYKSTISKVRATGTPCPHRWRFLNVVSCLQTLCHAPKFITLRKFVAVWQCFIKKNLSLPVLRLVQWFNLTWKTFTLTNSITKLSKYIEKVSWTRGNCVSGIICLKGLCPLKHALETSLSASCPDYCKNKVVGKIGLGKPCPALYSSDLGSSNFHPSPQF